MTFEEYLIKKRINKAVFEAEDAARYRAWENMYGQMHQNSFYMAVKMVINDVRLRYHLREEDVPKAAPAIVAPKPVVRRAPLAANPSETTPAVADEQQISEEKPDSIAVAFKPRPVVKRPASLQKPPVEEEVAYTSPLTEGEAATAEAARETEKPAAKPRPVFKRPIISKPASDEIAKLEEEKTQQTASPEVSSSSNKPVRPRPVINCPAALQKPAENETIQDPASVTSPVAAPVPTEQVPDIPKPSRPRPIIKRPIALATPPVEQDATAAENEAEPKAAEIPAKPSRSRPVIKRPAPAATQEPVASTQKDNKPENESNTQQVQEEKPKPPRPRPIMRRPTKPDDADSETNV